MKVYFHFNIDGFSNCYVVTNEKTMEALIIDPGKITKEILEQIENGPFDLTAVLIAKMLNLKEITLYKETGGIMSGDPSLIASPYLIKNISYDEVF